MDVQRAQQIASSSTMERVTCNEVPIYIHNVDARNEMVTISPLGQPHDKRDVHVTALIEDTHH